MAYNILVASYTDEIYSLSFNATAASLTAVTSVVVGHQPSWITTYPGDPSLVFVALEQSQGKIILVRFDNDGKGKVVGEVPSGGADPCSLLTTKDELFVANVCIIYLSRCIWQMCVSYAVFIRNSRHLSNIFEVAVSVRCSA